MQRPPVLTDAHTSNLQQIVRNQGPAREQPGRSGLTGDSGEADTRRACAESQGIGTRAEFPQFIALRYSEMLELASKLRALCPSLASRLPPFPGKYPPGCHTRVKLLRRGAALEAWLSALLFRLFPRQGSQAYAHQCITTTDILPKCLEPSAEAKGSSTSSAADPTVSVSTDAVVEARMAVSRLFATHRCNRPPSAASHAVSHKTGTRWLYPIEANQTRSARGDTIDITPRGLPKDTAFDRGKTCDAELEPEEVRQAPLIGRPSTHVDVAIDSVRVPFARSANGVADCLDDETNKSSHTPLPEVIQGVGVKANAIGVDAHSTRLMPLGGDGGDIAQSPSAHVHPPPCIPKAQFDTGCSETPSNLGRATHLDTHRVRRQISRWEATHIGIMNRLHYVTTSLLGNARRQLSGLDGKHGFYFEMLALLAAAIAVFFFSLQRAMIGMLSFFTGALATGGDAESAGAIKRFVGTLLVTGERILHAILSRVRASEWAALVDIGVLKTDATCVKRAHERATDTQGTGDQLANLTGESRVQRGRDSTSYKDTRHEASKELSEMSEARRGTLLDVGTEAFKRLLRHGRQAEPAKGVYLSAPCVQAQSGNEDTEEGTSEAIKVSFHNPCCNDEHVHKNVPRNDTRLSSRANAKQLSIIVSSDLTTADARDIDVEELLAALEVGLVRPLKQFGASLALAVQNDARNIRKVRGGLEAAIARETRDTGSESEHRGNGNRRMSVEQLLAYEVSSGIHSTGGGSSTNCTPIRDECQTALPFPAVGSPVEACAEADSPARSTWLRTPRSPPAMTVALADPSAAIGLTWLSRSLRFTSLLMRGICEGGASMSPVAANERLSRAMRDAYDAALLPYHGWLMQSIFAGCAKRAPSYEELLRFFAPEADGPERERLVLTAMANFARAADAVATAVAKLLAQAGLVDERKA